MSRAQILSRRSAPLTTVLILVAALIWATAALASAGQRALASKGSGGGAKIALIGEVTREGKGKGRGTCTARPRVNLLEGSRIVGSFGIKGCAGTLYQSVYEGTAKLEVGALKGRLKLHVIFAASGPPENQIPAKFGLGTLSNRQGSERFRISGGEIPSELGARFKFTLNTAVNKEA